MHASSAYMGAVRGGCFLTGLGPNDGGSIVDLDVDIEDLPGVGHMYVSETAVRMMNDVLGLKLVTPAMRTEHDELVLELAETHEKLNELMAAMSGIVNLPAVEHAMSIAARKVAGKESVHEWIDSLPKVERR